MGIVYLAIAQGPARFSKLLVVKELKPELVDDSSFLDMFLEEARLAARLSHPNIVQTYEVGAEGNRRYIVMDYLEGVTLARAIRKKSPKFTVPMQLRVVCEVLQALHYAHTLTDFDGTPLGIVHRDATPQNVFVTFDGQVKLVDFGIAKAHDSTLETRTGILKGKPAYMAPEQMSGDVDPRADVFAVGVMIWEAVAGRRMWHKKGDVEVLTSILKGEVPSLREAAPNAPEQLLNIVERALAPNREERYATAADLQADIEAYLVESKSNVTTREVGKAVGELFEDERKKTRSTIDAHLQQVRSGKAPSKLPSLRPGELESPSGPSARRGEDRGSMSGASEVSMLTSGRTPGGTVVPSEHSYPPPATPVSALGYLRQNKPVAIGGAALLLSGVVLIAARSSPAKEDAKAAAVARMSEPVAAIAVAPTPKVDALQAEASTHDILVRASPSQATIQFDGVPVANPGKRTCTHGQKIVLRVAAPGHIPRDREIVCDRDASLELALTAQAITITPHLPPPQPPRRPAVAAQAAAPPPAEPPPAAAAPAAPKSTSEFTPTAGTKPTRSIETASPYGN